MAARDSFTSSDETLLLATLANHSRRDQAYILTGLDTGFRAHELQALTIGHVMLPSGEIRDRLTLARRSMKFGSGVRARTVKSRTVPLTPRVQTALRGYLNQRFRLSAPEFTHPLFLSSKGGGLSIWQQARIVKRLAAQAGCDPCRNYGAHTMRKTFARKIHAAAHDINVTRQALGHAAVNTTQRYLAEDAEHVATLIAGLGGQAA